jgi:hypothetical protein
VSQQPYEYFVDGRRIQCDIGELTGPSSSCTWPDPNVDADTCAMRGADINSWIFFRDRL